jgi:hypothetical protein
MPAKNEWRQILEELRPPAVNVRTFETWLRPTHLRASQNGTLIVSVPTEEFGDYLRDELGTKIAEAMVKCGLRKEIIYQPADGDKSIEPMVGMLASEIKTEKVRWLWPSFLPRSKIVIIEGDPGVGKSTISLDIAARLSTSSPWPDGWKAGARPRGTVVITAEDGLADTIKPRLEVHDANLSLINIVREIRDANGSFQTPSLPRDLAKIASAITSVDASLLILDPFTSFLPPDVNSWKDQDCRRVLAPLASFAERCQVTVLVVGHLNKRWGGPAIYRGGGSIAIQAAARTVLLVGLDHQNPKRRILAPLKSNLAALCNPLAFEIEDLKGTGHVRWLGQSSDTAESILANCEGSDGRSALQDAMDFLQAELERGQRPAKEVVRRAHEIDIRDRTLRRARVSLGVTLHRPDREHEYWSWSLGPRAGKGSR